jgi:hypothetical protein
MSTIAQPVLTFLTQTPPARHKTASISRVLG